jgi:hypothetical protein
MVLNKWLNEVIDNMTMGVRNTPAAKLTSFVDELISASRTSIAMLHTIATTK